jgi:hypothetical protein
MGYQAKVFLGTGSLMGCLPQSSKKTGAKVRVMGVTFALKAKNENILIINYQLL